MTILWPPFVGWMFFCSLLFRILSRTRVGKYKAGGEKIDFFKDTKDEDGDILMEGAKKFDAGLGVGVAYEINKFFIDLTGEFGLTKIYDGDGAPKNINFSIGVGYKF